MLASSLLKWRGTRVGIWEANAKMGLANRLITSWIDDVFLVFPFYGSSPKKGKIFVFGLPIRQELIDAAGVNPPQTEEDQHPEQSQNNGKTNGSENVRKLKIFIFGGSQGARGINEAILDLAEKYKDFFSSQLDVFHQTGQLDFESVKDRYEQLGLKVQIQAFVEDMARAYHWADLVVCRSGASSVAEIALFQKPTLFVPLPIAHDHQLENAKKLIEAEACLMIEQKNLTPETLKSIFLDFIKNPKKCQEIAKKLAPFRRPDSAQLIAKQVLSSILAK
jgi:UDP-N-acetylglucosamine--N-acetylmuramyl-(pentapeptide) pyrophosphoryl-undecaprenol N-acetylglucosamine transferase